MTPLEDFASRVLDIAERPQDMFDEEGFPTAEWNEIVMAGKAALTIGPGHSISGVDTL